MWHYFQARCHGNPINLLLKCREDMPHFIEHPTRILDPWKKLSQHPKTL
jgi:hypothetical protein